MGTALVTAALLTLALVCGLGFVVAVSGANGSWRPCDRCRRQVMERFQVVAEHPRDPLYPVSVELVCERCLSPAT
jgi:hypothetical protein